MAAHPYAIFSAVQLGVCHSGHGPQIFGPVVVSHMVDVMNHVARWEGSIVGLPDKTVLGDALSLVRPDQVPVEQAKRNSSKQLARVGLGLCDLIGIHREGKYLKVGELVNAYWYK